MKLVPDAKLWNVKLCSSCGRMPPGKKTDCSICRVLCSAPCFAMILKAHCKEKCELCKSASKQMFSQLWLSRSPPTCRPAGDIGHQVIPSSLCRKNDSPTVSKKGKVGRKLRNPWAPPLWIFYGFQKGIRYIARRVRVIPSLRGHANPPLIETLLEMCVSSLAPGARPILTLTKSHFSISACRPWPRAHKGSLRNTTKGSLGPSKDHLNDSALVTRHVIHSSRGQSNLQTD